jgi:Protein of unknown function (DUF3187)
MMPLPVSPPLPPAVTLFGPLPVRAQSSFSHLVFQSYPEKSSVLPRGEKSLTLNTDVGNAAFLIATKIGREWAEDAEMQQLRVSYRQGMAYGWEVGAETRLLSRNGGVLDSLISGWHRYFLFNLKEPFRDNAPRNQLGIYIIQNGQLVLQEDQNATALTLLALTVKKQVTPTTALRGTIKFPLTTSKHYLDNGVTDIALGLSTRLSTRGRFTPQLDASLLYAGTSHVGTAFQKGNRLSVQMIIAGEYTLKGDASMLLQQENATFPYRFDLAKAPLRRQQLTLGYTKRRVLPRTNGFFSISENLYGPIVVGYAPDFQVSFGLNKSM